MKGAILLVLGVSLVAVTVVECSEKETARDSYLDAYKASHHLNPHAQKLKKSDREYTDGPYPYPAAQPGPQYGPPSAPASPVYGPPSAPGPAYGPPAPVYGPPLSHPQPFYGVPHGMLSILDKIWHKFKFKLDLYTLGKVLLKIIIFKKIVAFIAIICLLLFIPALKHKKQNHNNNNNHHHDEDEEDEDEDDDERSFKPKLYTGQKSLNAISAFVIEAIDNFSKADNKSQKCNGVYCNVVQTLNGVNEQLAYSKLAKIYADESKSQ